MSPLVRGQPPGRAGLQWLVRRSAVAERGSSLLERKLRILLAEEQAYMLRTQRTQRLFDDATARLDLWLLRAGLISGQRGLRLASDGPAAGVRIDWRLTMGVRYPATVTCDLPDRPGGSAPDSAAVRHARAAAEQTVRAATEHAAASTALAAISAEVVATRRQLRGLQRRWLPRLAAAKDLLLIQLDDLEHDEHVRLRWVADTRPTRRPGP